MSPHLCHDRASVDHREWWRTPDAESRSYLTQLAAWGYPLSRVVQMAAGIPPEDDTDEADAEPERGEETATEWVIRPEGRNQRPSCPSGPG